MLLVQQRPDRGALTGPEAGRLARILVIEDDAVIGPSLVRLLVGAGYQAELASSATDARRLVEPGIDLMLLDLNLPDADGIDLCPDLRAAAPGATIVVLTARTAEIDVVIGLDSGADDYVTKPFRPGELLARIRAHLRRFDDAGLRALDVLSIGLLEVDLGARRVRWRSREIDLRPKEFDLLAVLAQQAGLALTREQLMSEVWDENWFGSTKTLDMHVSALRRKLADEVGGIPLTTLRGVGYRLELG